MTIFIGSRYENELPFDVTDPLTEQVRETVLSTRDVITGRSFRYHLWCETDRIDRLAERYLGNASEWWYIMDANPELLSPLDVSLGSLIRIPDA